MYCFIYFSNTNLIALHHVSTTGVNYNLTNNSVAMEEVPPWVGGEDWEAQVQQLVSMESAELEREEPNILKRYGFPNTYTMTKHLAEQALKKKRRPDLRLTISRPAGVSATQKYPFPGWTDSIGAGGAIVYNLGRGVTHRDFVYDNVVSQFVPCDYVVNLILLATAVSASLPTPGFEVYHSSPTVLFPDYSQ